MENKDVDIGVIPRSPKPPDRWGYESHLKEYLLLLATKGSIALEKTRQFPEKIELGTTWHEMLNKMRESTTLDGIEKWAFAGAKAEKRGIFLPTVPIKGTSDYVPSETMKKMMDWARNKQGIVDFLGDIHSHPDNFAESLSKRALALVMDKHNLVEVFSAGDFYSFITQPDMWFMGVVARDYNIFAFKAKESTGLGVSQDGFTQDDFEKYWYEKFGFKYLGSAKKFGAQRAIPVSLNADQKKMNIEIARKHGLLIYQGKANKDLIKIFPR
ncbi:MAG TPA: hypothetical protein VI795_03900 [Patescibacteria group bacterium]|nr:hypothetical protein [Patescibacteria group bacterium]